MLQIPAIYGKNYHYLHLYRWGNRGSERKIISPGLHISRSRLEARSLGSESQSLNCHHYLASQDQTGCSLPAHHREAGVPRVVGVPSGRQNHDTRQNNLIGQLRHRGH